MINMKLMLPVALVLLFASAAFCDKAVEVDVGYSSPNKGLIGVRYSPESMWSFGIIWGSVSNFADFGIAGSYHFSEFRARGLVEPYIFQSHHILKSKVGNVWEINTGGGAQYITRSGFMAYTELGIPFYIGGYSVWRDYKEGVPRNRNDNGRVIMFSFRTGIGIGYRFEFF